MACDRDMVANLMGKSPSIYMLHPTNTEMTFNLCSKGPVTQRFTALIITAKKGIKLFPVKQTMLFALMSSLRRAIVDL